MHKGKKMSALRVVMLLRYAMVEREDAILCDPSNGVPCLMHAQAHGSVKVRLAGAICKSE